MKIRQELAKKNTVPIWLADTTKLSLHRKSCHTLFKAHCKHYLNLLTHSLIQSNLQYSTNKYNKQFIIKRGTILIRGRINHWFSHQIYTSYLRLSMTSRAVRSSLLCLWYNLYLILLDRQNYDYITTEPIHVFSETERSLEIKNYLLTKLNVITKSIIRV